MQQLMFGQLRENIPDGEVFYITGKEIYDYAIRADLPIDMVREAVVILLGVDQVHNPHNITQEHHIWVRKESTALIYGRPPSRAQDMMVVFDDLFTTLMEFLPTPETAIRIIDGDYFAYDPEESDPDEGIDLLYDEYINNEWLGGDVEVGDALALVIKQDSKFEYCKCGGGDTVIISPVRVKAITDDYLVILTTEGEACINKGDVWYHLFIGQADLAPQVHDTVGGDLSGLQLANIITNYITD